MRASLTRLHQRERQRLTNTAAGDQHDDPVDAHAEAAGRRHRVLECLQEVRQQGWCIVDQELEQGLRSIAVPVYDASGQVLAALNVSTHAGRVGRNELEQRFLPGLLSASRELSAQLFA